jgi:hypothetical protein
MGALPNVLRLLNRCAPERVVTPIRLFDPASRRVSRGRRTAFERTVMTSSVSPNAEFEPAEYRKHIAEMFGVLPPEEQRALAERLAVLPRHIHSLAVKGMIRASV